MNPSDILIVVPTSMELKPLQPCIREFHIENTLVAGVGPGATAHRLTMTLARRVGPMSVIFAGIAGAYPGTGISTGDVCIASSETYGDLGRCGSEGFEPIELPGEETVATYFDLVPAWKPLLPIEKISQAGIHSVPMNTVSCTSIDAQRAASMSEYTGAVLENMEGAAAAQSCFSFGIPLVEIRAVSNMAGEADRGKWHIRQAMERLAEGVRKVVQIMLQDHIGSIPRLS